MRDEALALGSLHIDVAQLLTVVLGAYIALLLGLYIQDRMRPLVSWTVLFDGPVNLRAPGMWEIAWQGDPVRNASLVILEVANLGGSITDAYTWLLPLSFRFAGRDVVHFKIRDSVDFHRLIQPPPNARDTPDDARAHIQGEMIELPRVPLNRGDRFKLLVLLTGAGTGVTAEGGLKGRGRIKKRGGHRRRNQIIAIAIAAALGASIAVVQAHDTVTWWVLASILVALTALLLSAYWLWPKIGTRVPVNMDAVLTSRITRHGDAWWAVATILICLGGVALIGDIVISNTSPQLTHSAEIFQEIANAGTFLAAAAAWATVTLNRRAARRSTAESAPPKHPKDAEGLSDNEYRFMTEFMNNVMLGRLNSTQAAQIERMIMILRESGTTMELPLVVTGNGESAVSPAKSRAEPGSQSQRSGWRMFKGRRAAGRRMSQSPPRTPPGDPPDVLTQVSRLSP